ncbi:MAG: ubiquitin-like small modifier protein 1 [Candidatus Helarchaeota archaeon]
MEIMIEFFASLKDLANIEKIHFIIEKNSTIKSILEKLKNKLGNNFEEKIFNSSEKLNKYVMITLNGMNINKLSGLDTIVKNGDEILMIPAVAGG